MDSWQGRRGHFQTEAFQESVKAKLGIDWPAFDEAFTAVENVLCGVDPDIVDVEYPAGPGGVRVFKLVDSSLLPPVRIAFKFEDDHGNVHFLDIDPIKNGEAEPND